MRKLIAATLGFVAATNVAAHQVGGSADALAGGQVQAWLAILLIACVLLYARGAMALWHKAGVGRGIRPAEIVWFALGWTALAIALLSPIDTIADRSFALHMFQHEILMTVAAPLLVLGRPLQALAWSLSSRSQRTIAAAARATPMRAVGRAIANPASAWTFHALAVWLWHLPMLFRLALASTPIHIFQHVCFFGSALAFWWTIFGGATRTPDAAAVVSVFTTMLHTSALGALLTFAPTPWYLFDVQPPFGLTLLEDQQLGGLVMWVPGGMAYMIAGLVIVGKWLARSDAHRPA